MEKQPINPKKSNQSIISAFILTLFNSIITVCFVLAIKTGPSAVIGGSVMVTFLNLPLQILATVLAIKYYRTVSPQYKIMAIISLIPFGLFCCMIPLLILASMF